MTIIGLLIFSWSLFIGIQAAGFCADEMAMPMELVEFDDYPVTDPVAMAPVGVRVSYVGVKDATMRFLIYNGSTVKLSCLGYSGICASPEIRINGLDASAWVCMNGSVTYEIPPGDTVEMMVSPEDFARVPGRKDKVEVGFRSSMDRSSDQYFGQPIAIPDAFTKEIRNRRQ